MADQYLSVSQPALIDAWEENLPFQLHDNDVFKCTYLDDGSVRVDLIDAEKNNESIDEHTPIIQDLVADYVRHIHECAQAVQSVTHI